MEFDRPKEDLTQFKARVKAIESGRNIAVYFLYITLPLAIIGVIFLAGSLIWHYKCLLSILGIILWLLIAGCIFLWYHFKRAEEFEEERRGERIREMNGAGKCTYLEGNVPDGSGKIGKCILYNFTLDSYPYCIYCREYRPRARE